MKYASSMEFNEKQVLAEKTATINIETSVGMLLKSDYGPANTPIKISSESELIKIFGYPTDYNYIDWFNASGYLKYASSLYVVRPLATTTENAYMSIQSGSITYDNVLGDLYNETIALQTLDDLDISSGYLNIYKKYVTSLDDISILICRDETSYYQSISKDDIFDNTLAVKTIYVDDPSEVNNLPSDVTSFSNGDRVVVDDGTYNVYYLTKTTSSTGYWTFSTDVISDGDRVYIQSEKLAYTFESDDGSWTVDSTITTADVILQKRNSSGMITNSVVRYMDNPLYDSNYDPFTFEYILPRKPDFTQNEIGLIVLKKNKEDYFEIVETFVNSLTSTSKQSNGKSNYIDTNINKYSKYIYCKSNGCTNTLLHADVNSSVYTNIILDNNTDYSNIVDYDTLYESASSVFGPNGFLIPEILIGHDCGDSSLLSGYLNAMPLISKETEMSLAIVGLTRSTIGLSEGDTNTEVVSDLGNKRTDTSIGALTEFNSFTFAVGQMKKFYDKYNDKYRWVSVAGDIAGMMCRNDSIFGVQSPCAGYNRGEFNNQSKLLFDSTINQDLLSYNGINAIIYDNTEDKNYLFEYMTNTTLDEIVKEANVRRMVIRIKHLLKTVLRSNFFEFNNEATRNSTLYKIKGIFEYFKKIGGLYDYKLICDETNNTAETINANEFVLDIRLQPNRVIKHIQINIVNFDMGINIKEF